MPPNRTNTAVTGRGYNSQSSNTDTTLTKSYLLNRRASPPHEITNRQAMTILYWAREMSPNRTNTAVTDTIRCSDSTQTKYRISGEWENGRKFF